MQKKARVTFNVVYVHQYIAVPVTEHQRQQERADLHLDRDARGNGTGRVTRRSTETVREREKKKGSKRHMGWHCAKTD